MPTMTKNVKAQDIFLHHMLPLVITVFIVENNKKINVSDF